MNQQIAAGLFFIGVAIILVSTVIAWYHISELLDEHYIDSEARAVVFFAVLISCAGLIAVLIGVMA